MSSAARLRSLGGFVVAFLAAALAALVLSPLALSAQEGTTAVEIDGIGEDSGGQQIVYGRIYGSPSKCAKNRKVELSVDEGSGFKIVDTGRSSGQAKVFALAAQSLGVNARVIVPEARVTVNGKKYDCRKVVRPTDSTPLPE